MKRRTILGYAILSLSTLSIMGETKSIEISIPLESPITNIDKLSVNIPLCKYDKYFAISLTGDDALLGIYTRPFNYINGWWVDDDPVHHDGVEHPTTGIIPTRTLCYTDGCGNDVRFRLATHWVSSGYNNNIHKNGNIYTPQMWWSEVERFTDYNNGINNHGGVDDNPPLAITKTFYGVADTIGIKPYVFGIPGGSTGFPEAAKAANEVYFIEKGGYYSDYGFFLPFQYFTKENILKTTFARYAIDTKLLPELKSTLSDNLTEGKWFNFFCHDIKNSNTLVNGQLNTDICFSFLDYIYDNYGKGGDDNVWFAPSAEIYEYHYSRLNSVITYKIENNNLIINADIAYLPAFYFKELTFKISGVKSDASSIIFPKGLSKHSATTLSNNDILINISFSDFIIKIAEKYTSKAETTKTDADKQEALYFATQLAPEFGNPLITRINAISSFEINKSTNTPIILGAIGKLIIKGCFNNPINIYSIDGVHINSISSDGTGYIQYPIQSGFYIVGNKKVIVK